jgi:hypothetical protein
MSKALSPFFWLLARTGLVKPPPPLSPPFAALNAHFFRNGITAVGQMQRDLVLKDAAQVAAFRLGFDPGLFYVVTVMLSDDEEAATRVEVDTRAVPQVSTVARNGCLVMACTFRPANSILEQRVTAAFKAYQPDLRTTT